MKENTNIQINKYKMGIRTWRFVLRSKCYYTLHAEIDSDGYEYSPLYSTFENKIPRNKFKCNNSQIWSQTTRLFSYKGDNEIAVTVVVNYKHPRHFRCFMMAFIAQQPRRWLNKVHGSRGCIQKIVLLNYATHNKFCLIAHLHK